jgi:hypothetical protein
MLKWQLTQPRLYARMLVGGVYGLLSCPLCVWHCWQIRGGVSLSKLLKFEPWAW